MAELPFSIRAQLQDRRSVLFVLGHNGDGELGVERVTIGNGTARRKLAGKWAGDRRLTGGRFVETAAVEAELTRLELAALSEMQAIAEDGEAEEQTGAEAAAVVTDDTLAELAWNMGSGKPDFVIYDREAGGVTRAPFVETPTGRIIPPAAWAGIVTPGSPVEGSILLPADCDLAYSDENRLRQDINRFIGRYVELPAGGEIIAVEYVLLTWVHDAFDELPYLAFRTADCGRGKSRALETVGALCYRPMFVGGGSSAAATLRLIDQYGGTLLADEFDQKHGTELAADLNRILNQGFQRNRPLVKCTGEDNEPKPFRCFGPKLFALRQRLGDDATESRTLSVYMQQRTRADIPLNLPREAFDREALALRNRLLAWRLTNLEHIHIDPALADAGLEDRANQIGLPLLSVARTPGARSAIIVALQNQQAAVAADRGDTLAGEVWAAIVAVGEVGGAIRPRDVARELNRRRAEAEGVEVDRLRDAAKPAKVGRIMRHDLQLPPAGRDRHGVYYSLDPARMSLLARRFGGTPVEPTQPTSYTLHPNLHPENRIGGVENAENVGCVGCVGSAEGGVGLVHDVGSDPDDGPPLDHYEHLAGAADSAPDSGDGFTLGGGIGGASTDWARR